MSGEEGRHRGHRGGHGWWPWKLSHNFQGSGSSEEKGVKDAGIDEVNVNAGGGAVEDAGGALEAGAGGVGTAGASWANDGAGGNFDGQAAENEGGEKWKGWQKSWTTDENGNIINQQESSTGGDGPPPPEFLPNANE